MAIVAENDVRGGDMRLGVSNDSMLSDISVVVALKPIFSCQAISKIDCAGGQKGVSVVCISYFCCSVEGIKHYQIQEGNPALESHNPCRLAPVILGIHTIRRRSFNFETDA